MSAASRNFNKKVQLVLGIDLDAKNMEKEMAKVQSKLSKFKSSLADPNQDVETIFSGASSSKVVRAAQSSGRKAGEAFSKNFKDRMDRNLAAKGGGLGFDDYYLDEEGMRGKTTGIRHSIGKLRNSLLLLSFAIVPVSTAFKDWFKSIIETESALTGLTSVAIATGLPLQALKDYSLELEDKGFLSLRGSAAAQKNLASTHASFSQITSVMNALTDAAAFNRQGTLSMEEAIVGASQGIKNQNSIMIDNAGITKNVSVMYREYAAMIGTTSGKLDENQKRQAIINGILREAGLFAGNAEKAMNTYQGRLIKISTEQAKAKRELGGFIAPVIVDNIERLNKVFIDTFSNDAVMTGINAITTSLNKMTMILESVAKAGMGLWSIGQFGKILEAPTVQVTLLTMSLLRLRSIGAEFFSNKINSWLTSSSSEKESQKKYLETVSKLSNKNFSTKGDFDRFGAKDTLEAQALQYKKLSDNQALRTQIVEVQKAGNFEELRAKQLTLEMNELGKRDLETGQNKLKLQRLILQAQIDGFNVVRNSQKKDENGNWKQGSFSVIRGNQKLDSGDKRKQDLVAVGMGSEEMNKMLPLIGRLKAAAIKTFAQIKVGWLETKLAMQGATTTLGRVTALFKLLGPVAATSFRMIAAGINTIMIAFSWFTAIWAIYDLGASLFEKTKEIEKAQPAREKSIEIERKALRGLSSQYDQLNISINSLIDGESGLNYLVQKNGESFKKNREDANTWLQSIMSMEKTMETHRKEWDETTWGNWTQALDDKKAKFQELYSLVSEAVNSVNEAIEKQSDNLEKMVSTFGGAYSNLHKIFLEYSDSMREITANRSILKGTDLNKVGITDALTDSLQDGLKERNLFNYMTLAYEKQFQMQKNKLIIDSENKLKNTLIEIRSKYVSTLKQTDLTTLIKITEEYSSALAQLRIDQSQVALEAQNSAMGNSFGSTSHKINLFSQDKKLRELYASMKSNLSNNQKSRENIDGEKETPFSVITEQIKIMKKTMKEWKDLDSSVFRTVSKNVESYESRIISLNEHFKMMEAQGADNYLKALGEEGVKKFLVLLNDVETLGTGVSDKQTKLLTRIFNYTDFKDAMLKAKSETKNFISGIGSNISDYIETSGQQDLTKSLIEKFAEIDKANAVYYANLQKELSQKREALHNQFNISRENFLKEQRDLSKEEGEILKTRSLTDSTFRSTELNNHREFIADQKKLKDQYIKNLDESFEQFQKINKLDISLSEKDKKAKEDQFRTENELLKNYFKLRQEKDLDLFNDNQVKAATDKLKELNYELELTQRYLEFGEEGGKVIGFDKLLKNFTDAPTFELRELKLKEFLSEVKKSTLEVEKEISINKSKAKESSFLATMLGIDDKNLQDLNSQKSRALKALDESYLLGTDVSKVRDPEELNKITRAYQENRIAEEKKYNDLIEQEVKEHLKQIGAQFLNFFSETGEALGNQFFRTDFRDERNDLLAENKKLFMEGEISETKHLANINAINQHYANEVKNSWKDAYLSVTSNLIKMTQEFIKQKAIADSVEKTKGTDLFGSLGGFFTNLLPVAGLSVGLGLLDSLINSSKGKEIEAPDLTMDSSTNLGKFGGTIKAEDVQINITPTNIFEASQIFIGSGSVVEFQEQLRDLTVKSINDAIENKEINLDHLVTRG